MKTTDFTTTLLVDQTPREVYNAINNVRGWWSEEIEGSTDKLHDVFKYHYEDVHRCQIKVLELIPDKKVVWLIMDNYFKPEFFTALSMPFTKGNGEWIDTKVVFEISGKDNKTQIHLTHVGLTPEYECFEVCSNGWTHYIQESLLSLITTGKGQPNSTGNPQTESEMKFQSAAEA